MDKSERGHQKHLSGNQHFWYQECAKNKTTRPRKLGVASGYTLNWEEKYS